MEKDIIKTLQLRNEEFKQGIYVGGGCWFKHFLIFTPIWGTFPF